MNKKTWFEKQLEEAESGAASGDSRTLHRSVKELTGRPVQFRPIKNSSGLTLKAHDAQAEKWKEHFVSLLNCPEPETLHSFSRDDAVNELDINTEPPSKDEVNKVIKSFKNSKAAGLDNIHAELLKNGGEPVIRELTDLCTTVWESEEVPADWKDGVILPIPKKGSSLTA